MSLTAKNFLLADSSELLLARIGEKKIFHELDVHHI